MSNKDICLHVLIHFLRYRSADHCGAGFNIRRRGSAWIGGVVWYYSWPLCQIQPNQSTFHFTEDGCREKQCVSNLCTPASTQNSMYSRYLQLCLYIIFSFMCRHLELPYHWQIMKPNLQCLLPGETPDPSSIQHHLDTDSVFSITPVMGILSPAEEHEFLLTYCPKDVCALTHTA